MPLPKSRDEAEAYILNARAANAQGAALTLAVTPRARPTETIGALTLQAGPAAVASLGFWIGRPHQGQGFGAEAVEALLSMAFGLTHLSGVETALAPTNASSRKVLERLGFTPTRAERLSSPSLGGEAALEWMALDRAHFLAGVGARSTTRPLPSMGHQTISTGDAHTARALAFAAGQ
jgi:RimJ/RimL family protein N-acetyltransferase